jgi:hypothetical protein
MKEEGPGKSIFEGVLDLNLVDSCIFRGSHNIDTAKSLKLININFSKLN